MHSQPVVMAGTSLAAPDPTTLKKGSGKTQYIETWRHRNLSGSNQIAPFEIN